MSTDTAPPNNNTNAEMYTRNRRGSITQAALTNLFQRGNSVPNSNGFPNQSSGPVDTGRRRLSVTTLGLSGTSPTNTSFIRRGSMSTNSNNSDSIDENAIEDDDMYSKTAPTTPFVRRMSFGTSNMRNIRPNGSPGNGNNPSSPPTSQNGRPVPSGRKASLVGSPSQGSSLAAALSAGRRPSLASSVTQTSKVSTGPSSLGLVPRVPSSVLLGLPSRSPPPPHPGAPFTTGRNLFLRCRSLLPRLLLSSSRPDSLKDQSLMPFRREF
ncbi:hypothetical protein FOQG_07353 [Fusarium oxysporum f. sp. raphani 54005]|uniref:Uncharacterized protein n=7 Tax=Fusarium oxysporum TaxID=5507 RepID=X0D5E2_FUSOX|nr:hypothetical protein FOXG_00316 [Fusarium oxysporum f. sp. lycopersici 4287]EWZ50504.1 hypothetical protein FOZG_00998 [Fusarium oxysporum Fo47]EWZ92034.1 hypothetical protein FOWG_07333 [Fusarium oxysporum f. sp. lycopersici MN25]EXA53296.1 hypothetical protein FOVG_01191 [Fusarium oxysporum f. sp. pisi HDV247]EXK47737.1 hypothetical protein FOMG_00998 [Fusarium oxysporum f. sp. melonis 26406]EXK89867.1 hypothetical protein FOQG_07353 [Fusarium oxysporum f. sp. raphani 54005]EXL49429.1 hy